MGSPLAKNNAFGFGSPSWNLSFPSGNLTAAEIIAYLPHWLKSVDVIDRFVTNGGRSYTIAAMINEFRHLPTGHEFRPNSAQIMMSYGMRRAGFDKWTVGTHSEYPRPNPHLKETDLDVQRFRAPRETHPKSARQGQEAQSMRNNEVAHPVEFRNLALHVRRHPTGSDALDLARCVQYALAHPSERLLFPRDYRNLVQKLGGPAAVTHSHLDRQIFDRRDSYVFPSPLKSTPNKAVRTPIRNQSTPSIKRTGTGGMMPQSRRFMGHVTSPNSGSPLKRVMDAEGNVRIGGRRKSGRLANKARVNLREYDSDATDKEADSSSRSGYTTPAKMLRRSHVFRTPDTHSNDSDSFEDQSDADEDIPEAEMASDFDNLSPVRSARTRVAASKARKLIHGISADSQRKIAALEKQKARDLSVFLQSPREALAVLPPAAKPVVDVSPEMMFLARTFAQRQPVLLKSPTLSADRLRVDASTIYIYAAEGCVSMQEMWVSALSSVRFNGPRRHPPFRELHRLTDPLPDDVSDWAENIRWAKEQHRCFGSDTWTEYDYHLELITTHRRAMMWVSEEVIRDTL